MREEVSGTDTPSIGRPVPTPVGRGGEPNVKATLFRLTVSLAALAATLIVLGAPQKWAH
jgi:hypothetical protein